MPDPATHATVIAAPSVAVASTAVGITLWPFGVAFIFGFIALIYLDKMLLRQALFSIIGSTVIGGTFAQLMGRPVLLILVNRLPEIKPWADVNGEMTVIALIAIIIGLFCQKALPAMMRRADKTIGGKK